MPGWRSRICTALGLLTLVGLPRASVAYEFEVNAQTVGQGSSLYALHVLGPKERLLRRRISQSLRLHIWDLAGTEAGLSRFAPEPAHGPKLYFSSYLRLDQEFGSYGSGQVLLDGSLRDVIDAIPELEQSSLQLDMLYGYFGAEGLLHGQVDIFAGRLLDVDTLDWFSMDGLKARVHLPRSLALEGFGGLRVRDSSWLGSEALEPDGTSGALCEEYVEGALPGTGTWRDIDGLPMRPRSPLTSDDELCPQRQELMPTFGGAIATDGLRSLQARLSYRRSQSTRPGLLGEVDRLDYPDRGYYPNEGQNPGKWGVNEERIALSVRAPHTLGEQRMLVPFAALRYSLLHGLVDEAHAELRISAKAHSVEGEALYSAPTFDGDSIFNVFSSEPYSDLRTSYHYMPSSSSYRAYARAWGRRYHSEDSAQVSMAGADAASVYAGGVQGGASYYDSRDRQLRVDVFAEDGYGGRRAGSFLASRWPLGSATVLRTRLSLVHFADDSRSQLHGTNLGAQIGATRTLDEGVAATILFEENSNRIDRFALGVFAMLDLAFVPDM